MPTVGLPLAEIDPCGQRSWLLRSRNVVRPDITAGARDHVVVHRCHYFFSLVSIGFDLWTSCKSEFQAKF